MPKIVVNYDPSIASAEALLPIGRLIRRLVATAVSTEKTLLTEDDVDWFPFPYPPGTITTAPLSVELTTIGKEDRIAKLTEPEVRKLKQDMLEAGLKNYIPPSDPLLWIKFTNPAGVHV